MRRSCSCGDTTPKVSACTWNASYKPGCDWPPESKGDHPWCAYAPQRPLKPVWHLLPSGWSIPFTLLGTSWIVLLGSCSGVGTVVGVARGRPAQHEVEVFLSLFGFGILPVGAVLLFVGALLAGRWAARTALLLATTVAAAIGLVFMLVGGMLGDEPEGTALVAAIIYLFPLAILLMALILSAAMAVREVRKSIADHRHLRVSELLRARGEVSFDTLGDELGLSPVAMPPFLRDVMRLQTTQAVVDEETKMLFSPERYARKQWDLVSVSYGRGQVSLDALSDELKLSDSRLKELLLAAMHGGLFSGFVDWRHRKVVSADASRLRQTHQCPGCGAQMDIVGRGLVVCSYCEAEVFLT